MYCVMKDIYYYTSPGQLNISISRDCMFLFACMGILRVEYTQNVTICIIFLVRAQLADFIC
jgi:hypothetical protein